MCVHATEGRRLRVDTANVLLLLDHDLDKHHNQMFRCLNTRSHPTRILIPINPASGCAREGRAIHHRDLGAELPVPTCREQLGAPRRSVTVPAERGPEPQIVDRRHLRRKIEKASTPHVITLDFSFPRSPFLLLRGAVVSGFDASVERCTDRSVIDVF